MSHGDEDRVPFIAAAANRSRYNDPAIPDTTVASWDAIKAGIVDVPRKLPYSLHTGWAVIATDLGYQFVERQRLENVGFLHVDARCCGTPGPHVLRARGLS